MKKSEEASALIIYGCGGHARSVADVALHNGIKHLIFVDKQAKKNEKLFEFDVINDFTEQYHDRCIVAIGDNQERSKIFDQLIKKNINVISLFSHNAYLGKNAQLDAGVFVGHAAHIGPNVKIGAATLINTHCIVEHDCLIGKYCHISVNAVVAGKTQIGDFVMIGAGATVIDRLHICSHVTIGAGSVVVQSINEPGTYVGIPAKRIHPTDFADGSNIGLSVHFDSK